LPSWSGLPSKPLPLPVKVRPKSLAVNVVAALRAFSAPSVVSKQRGACASRAIRSAWLRFCRS
jgi:hypothetical protein